MSTPTAVVIGSGFGGLSLAIRLQGLGFDVTVVEQLDKPGGRAYVREHDGFYFDMGPTVITVPQFIEELFSIEVGDKSLNDLDFPNDVNPVDYSNTKRYCDIRPIFPFYRIYFDDGTFFDYDGDPERTRQQILNWLQRISRVTRDSIPTRKRSFVVGLWSWGTPTLVIFQVCWL